MSLLRRLLLMTLLFASASWAVPAVHAWAVGWGPRQTVCAFAEALKSGDRCRAASLSSPEIARTMARQATWEPSARMIYRIDAVEVSGDLAKVTATLSEYGVSVQPQFSLARTADGGWQVIAIRE